MSAPDSFADVDPAEALDAEEFADEDDEDDPGAALSAAPSGDGDEHNGADDDEEEDPDEDGSVPDGASGAATSRGSRPKKRKAPPHPLAASSSSSPATAAANALASGGSQGGGGGDDRGPQGENTGRWTAEEHSLFLQGLEQHGKGWKKIAQLIKSRTVVQIRTHAQKYFQKMTKARQGGEDGEVLMMDGRGGVSSVASASPTAAGPAAKRRRPATGTKRKAIQSVVASAVRQGKKMASAQTAAGVTNPTPPLPAVAPILAHFILPHTKGEGNSGGKPFEDLTTISGPVLEDSIFRFLTPAPLSNDLPLNDVARQAGANPITVPSEHAGATPTATGGEVSPTGVSDFSLYPSWVDGKDPPSWYAKGADVDALLDVSDTLDWLEDTGDLHETYQRATDLGAAGLLPPAKERLGDLGEATNHTSVATLPQVESVVPPLPSLFGDAIAEAKKPEPVASMELKLSTSTTSIDEHLNVFESTMEEHDFVSTILENNNESSPSLPALT